jgi:hypothetical protein
MAEFTIGSRIDPVSGRPKEEERTKKEDAVTAALQRANRILTLQSLIQGMDLRKKEAERAVAREQRDIGRYERGIVKEEEAFARQEKLDRLAQIKRQDEKIEKQKQEKLAQAQEARAVAREDRAILSAGYNAARFAQFQKEAKQSNEMFPWQRRQLKASVANAENNQKKARHQAALDTFDYIHEPPTPDDINEVYNTLGGADMVELLVKDKDGADRRVKLSEYFDGLPEGEQNELASALARRIKVTQRQHRLDPERNKEKMPDKRSILFGESGIFPIAPSEVTPGFGYDDSWGGSSAVNIGQFGEGMFGGDPAGYGETSSIQKRLQPDPQPPADTSGIELLNRQPTPN